MPHCTEFASVHEVAKRKHGSHTTLEVYFNRTGIFTPIDVFTVRVMVMVTVGVRSGESVWSTVLLNSSDQ